jgi:hypothetical protein
VVVVVRCARHARRVSEIAGRMGVARGHAPLLGVEAAPTAVKPATPISIVDRISARMSMSFASSSADARRAASSGSATTAARVRGTRERDVAGGLWAKAQAPALAGEARRRSRDAPPASIARRAWRAAATLGAASQLRGSRRARRARQAPQAASVRSPKRQSHAP